MDEFASILHRDYGLKPQGKSAPMTSAAKSSAPSPFSSSSPNSVPSSIYRTSSAPKQKTGPSRNSKVSNSESLDDDLLFGSSNGFSATKAYGSPFSDTPGTYDDVFGGPPKFTTPLYPPAPSFASQQSSSSQSYDDIFRMPAKSSSSNSASFSKGSSFPVFDAPLYDDDIFGGVAGIRNTGVVYDDVFSGTSNVGTSPNVLEDLLGMSESKDRSSGSQQQQPVSDSSTTSAKPSAFDDLLPGFGAKVIPTGAEKSRDSRPHDGLDKNSLGMPPGDPFDGIHIDDPFDVQQFAGSASASDVREPSPEPVKGSARSSRSRHKQNASRDDTSRDSSPHLFKARSPPLEKSRPSRGQTPSPTTAPSYTPFIDTNSVSRSASSSNGTAESKRDSSSPSPAEQNEAPAVQSPSRKGRQVYDDVEEPVHLPKAVDSRPADEYWISVEDMKLVTEPTAMPPPSRRPPLPVMKHGHNRRRAPGARGESSLKGSSSRHDSPKSSKLSSSSIEAPADTSKKSTVNAPSNTYEELEQFASGVAKSRKDTKMDMSAPTLGEEILEGSAAVSASAMAMKEAMERARSKLWEGGKEQRESGASRSEGIQQGGKETKEEDEVNKVGPAEESQRIREREEKEREAKALREERDRRRREREKEKENEREREREREREKDRIAFERAAVERANAEARERLAAEVRQRAAADRAAADAREQAAAAEARERAAVEKVTAEARERAAADARERAAAEAREKAAAERATAEARERAAAEARERVAAEKATSEARARAERAFVERVHAEARERAAGKAAAEARERVTAERAAAEARERAAAAKEQHRRSENDLEAFFAASSRPASAPRQRSPVKATSTDGRQVNKNFSSDVPQRASAAASGARKTSATTSNDDLASLFGSAVPPAGEFQEVEGESAERRKARWERHQRTAERAAKALDEKNQRDLQSQREQAERHRAGEVVDVEIKRWAAGKEGNLRALLSTLQYVLWPESGWQAVSLTDLITAAAVKKVYRKATLFVHPDKVQQKGATIHQKYIAEKVFDLLKEAWNKFNSEELF